MKNRQNKSPLFHIISPILAYFVINYLVSLVFLIYAMFTTKADINSKGAIDTLLSFAQDNIFLMEIGVYLITFIYVYFLRYRREERLKFDKAYLNSLEAKDVLCAVICGVAVYLFTDIVLVILDGLFGIQSLMAIHNEAVSSILTNYLVLDIILIGVIAPITEEILFRGLIFNRLRLYINEQRAIIISAVIFSCMHMGSIIQNGYAFLLGWVLAYSYTKYENIKIPIIIHMAFNLTNALSLIPKLSEILNTTVGYLVYYIIGVAFTVITVKNLKNKRKPLSRKDLVVNEDEMLRPW